jgi:hypothetical protein
MGLEIESIGAAFRDEIMLGFIIMVRLLALTNVVTDWCFFSGIQGEAGR